MDEENWQEAIISLTQAHLTSKNYLGFELGAQCPNLLLLGFS